MRLKPSIFKAIELAALGAGCVSVASFASFAIGGITLFAASPFIPDSSEEAIVQWTAKSALFAAAGASATFLCWHVLFDSVGMGRRSRGSVIDNAEFRLEIDLTEGHLRADTILQAADEAVKTPQICRNCKFVNPDFLTRSLLLCAVRGCPESDVCCPDKQPVGRAGNG